MNKLGMIEWFIPRATSKTTETTAWIFSSVCSTSLKIYGVASLPDMSHGPGVMGHRLNIDEG